MDRDAVKHHLLCPYFIHGKDTILLEISKNLAKYRK